MDPRPNAIWFVADQGEYLRHRERFSQLQTTYHFGRGTQVALETGTVTFVVARQLGRFGLDPIVVNAHIHGLRISADRVR